MDPNESFDAIYQALMLQQEQDRQQEERQQELEHRQRQHSLRVQLLLQQQQQQQQLGMISGQQQQQQQQSRDEQGGGPAPQHGGGAHEEQPQAPRFGILGNSSLAYYENSLGAFLNRDDLAAVSVDRSSFSTMPQAQQFDPMSSFLGPTLGGQERRSLAVAADDENRRLLLQSGGAPTYSSLQHQHPGAPQPLPYVMDSSASQLLFMQPTAPANESLLLAPDGVNGDGGGGGRGGSSNNASYTLPMSTARGYLTSSEDGSGGGGSEPSATERRSVVSEKERFVMFVKILLLSLDRLGNGSDARNLKAMAKATILECTRRNRMGDASYTPLLVAIERHLRGAVGDAHWSRASRLCNRYFERRRASSGSAAAAAIPLAAV